MIQTELKRMFSYLIKNNNFNLENKMTMAEDLQLRKWRGNKLVTCCYMNPVIPAVVQANHSRK